LRRRQKAIEYEIAPIPERVAFLTERRQEGEPVGDLIMLPPHGGVLTSRSWALGA